MLCEIEAGVLRVTYADSGPRDGPPVVLLHGFPYDIHAYEAVTPALVAAGCRVFTPYLRGYGPTRFLASSTLRSGEQAALGADLLAFINALQLERPLVAGYDWGGRAACVVAALWPERVRALVTCGGYNIQNIAAAGRPQPPENEYRYWYQYYFHGERGRAGLQQNRRALCRLLWRLWSPNWSFDEASFERSAAAFDNPDFVDVVIHSYRHRFGLVDGDPALAGIEARLAVQPRISAPTIALDGEGDGVTPAPGSARHAIYFSGSYERRTFARIGHNLPQEAPTEFADAVLRLMR